MTQKLIRSVKVIHHLERSIRVLELVRERTQQAVNQAIACCERQGRSAETDPTVAKARALIAAYNRAILGAKAQINKLETGCEPSRSADR